MIFMTQQDKHLTEWLKSHFSADDFSLRPLVGDASFRRYFRLSINNESLIAVDSPPATENNSAFVIVANAFADLGLDAPKSWRQI